jgi:subtilisin-like proprotein convertase family protein
MKLLFKFFALVIVSVCSLNGYSQISVTGGLTAQQMAEILAGSNITVTNAVITGPAGGYGSFSSVGGFPFSSGVILTNGLLTEAPGPNNDPNTSSNLGGAGTTEMTTLGGANSYDVVTLEFDFVVQSSAIQFQYIFASEEYPEFAPPNQPSFNDVFAFYISGPGIVGQENVALIPGTTNPVSIDNVNPVTYPQYYVDNTAGQQIQFDGYTTDITAVRTGLTPCQTYHLRMVIADIQTSNRNSAVFLKENSFVQENVLGAETQTINADGIALEGCVQGSFAFEFTDISSQDRTINFTIGGNAVNGVDYSYLDNYITIPAGELTGTVYIDAFSDGLSEGAETITLTYNSGVCVGTETVTLTINDAQPIDFTLDGTNLDCFEDNSGEILVNATGGFPGYTYYVTDPNGATSTYTNNPITGLAAGQYSVQVHDTYGCKAEALVIGGQFNAGVTFLPDGSGVTYEAPLDITGFNPGQTITSVDQIQQICLTMEHSYLGDLWIRVESPSGAVVTLKQQNGGGSCDLGEPVATGPVDGQGSSDTTPGSGYEYCFNANPTYGTMVNESNNFTRNYTDAVGNSYTDTYLPAGSYTASGNFSAFVGSPMNGTWKVYVTDQFGLDNGYIFNWYISLIGDMPDTTVILTQPAEITLSGLASNATCGSSNGSVNVSVLNGVAPVTYSWSNGATTEDLTGVPAGQYTLTATDANGCAVSETFLVNNIGTLAISSTATPATCFGGSDGAIAITVTGGTTPYSFSWSNGSTLEDQTGLFAGNLTVTVTDNIGCQLSQVISVGQNAQILPTLAAASDEICNTTNGSIDISVTGGNGSYGYSWSNGATTQDLSGLNSGTYAITVTDGLGCTGTGSFSIANNLTGCSNYCFLNVTGNTLVDATCGNANGSVNVNILNAVAPYTVTWSNGATTEDLSGLSPGTYSVTVLDANNCSNTSSFTVSNNSGTLAVTSAAIGDETCGNNNGSIDLTISGGTAPYSYSWSNGGTVQDIQGLAAGNFTVTVTDNSGCSMSESFTVQNNTGSLNVTGQVSSAICSSNNGSILQTVNASNGAVSFQWNTGATSQNLSGLAPGSYTCAYTDASGCSGSNTYTVGQNNGGILLTGTLVTNETCINNQGAINITATGNGLTYLWSNGATTEDISGLSAGNYSCTITNGQGCSLNTGSITLINSPGNMTVSNQSVTAATCSLSNGAIDVNIFGGQSPFTYSWSNGATTQDISGLVGGVYTLQLLSSNGCSLAHSVTVPTQSGTLDITGAVITNESCIAGSGTNGQGAVNISVAGATTPYTYVWSNGATTQDITGVTDGQYTVTVTSANGCSLTESFAVLANGSNIAITSSSVADESCGSAAGSISVTMSSDSGPYSYSWSNGATTEDLQNLTAGNYTLNVSNSFGCQLSETFTVGNDPGSLAVSAVVTDETCGNANGAINASVTGGSSPYSYAWSNGSTSQDLSAITAGNYEVTVSDQYGCYVNYSGTVVNVANGLSVSITAITSDVCGQGVGAVNATATGAASYTWSNGATTEDLSGVTGGTYTLTVSDGLGCSASAAAIVPNQTGSLAITFSNVSNETCGNGQGFIDIEVGGTGPFTYSWSNSALSQDLVSLGSGIYTVTVTDGAACQLSETFTVSNDNVAPIAIDANVTDAFCSSSNGSVDVTVTAGITPFSFSWGTGDNTEDIANVAAGNYVVTITDGVNCQSAQTVVVGSQNSGLGFTGLDINPEFCGNNNGSITFFTGGTADDYYLDGVSLGIWQADNLSAGTYTVAISDNFGCYVDSIVTVGSDAFFNMSYASVDASCGQSNGSINLNVFGGGPQANYTYLWSNGATTQDLNNIPAGTYTVTVTSPGGGPNPQPCSDEVTIVLNNDVDFVITGTSGADYCGLGSGSIDQTIVSGTNLTFLWSNGATTEDVSGLIYGDYTCNVSFPGGCTEVFEYTVGNTTSGAAATALVNDEQCADGTGAIDLTITGGVGPFDLSWANGPVTEDQSSLAAGNYSVTIVDQNDGCTFTETFTLTNVVTVFNAISIVTNSTCSTCTEGSVNVIIANSSNYTFNWSNGATTEDVFGLTPGTYSVVITSAQGCDTTMNFTVLNTASLDDLNASTLEMSVYPNPATTEFNVSLLLPAGLIGSLIVTDVIGKEVLSVPVSESGILEFEGKDMKDGVYFITFRTGNYSKMERLVISKN